MRRRDFFAVVISATSIWSRAAVAQQSDRAWRIGVLMSGAEADPQQQANISALVQGLQDLKWSLGGSLLIDYRWGAADAERMQRYARELVALKPDAMLVQGAAFPAAFQATSKIPIVFVLIADPVRRGIVASLARPGGNCTGFTQNAIEMGGKWLELLKEIAPRVARVAFVFNPEMSLDAASFLAAVEAAAPSFGVGVTRAPVTNAAEIDSVIASFARQADGGLVIEPSAFTLLHRQQIIELAARHRLPAVYPFPLFADAGGLLSYGIDEEDQFRQAASYIDRILKGTAPGELPVQQPTKFRLVINAKTAKTLGLEIMPMLLARADKVVD
jgi:putative ABC transport system substrate-binding protein